MKAKIKLMAFMAGLLAVLPMTSAWADSSYSYSATLSATANPTGAGSVYVADTKDNAKAKKNLGTYEKTGSSDSSGNDVKVTLYAYAVPNAGYEFTGWTGATATDGDTCSVSLTCTSKAATQTASVTANFAKMQLAAFGITFETSDAGTYTVDEAAPANKTGLIEATTIKLESTDPNFLNWTVNGETVNDNPYELTCIKDTAVSVVFLTADQVAEVTTFDELTAALANDGKKKMIIPNETELTVAKASTLTVPAGKQLVVEGKLWALGEVSIAADAQVLGNGSIVKSFKTVSQDATIHVPFPDGTDGVAGTASGVNGVDGTAGKYLVTSVKDDANTVTGSFSCKEEFVVTVENKASGKTFYTTPSTTKPVGVLCTTAREKALNWIDGVNQTVYSDVATLLNATATTQASYTHEVKDHNKLAVLTGPAGTVSYSDTANSSSALGFIVDLAGQSITLTSTSAKSQWNSTKLVRFFNGSVTISQKVMNTNFCVYNCTGSFGYLSGSSYYTAISFYDSPGVKVSWQDLTSTTPAGGQNYYGGATYNTTNAKFQTTPGDGFNKVYAGTFASGMNPTKYLYDTNKVTAEQDSSQSNAWVVKKIIVDPNKGQVRVNGLESTLADALANAKTGDVIILQRDVELDSDLAVAAQNVRLDLSGWKLTGASAIVNNGDLEIIDSNGNGQIDVPVINNGTLLLSDAVYNGAITLNQGFCYFLAGTFNGGITVAETVADPTAIAKVVGGTYATLTYAYGAENPQLVGLCKNGYVVDGKIAQIPESYVTSSEFASYNVEALSTEDKGLYNRGGVRSDYSREEWIRYKTIRASSEVFSSWGVDCAVIPDRKIGANDITVVAGGLYSVAVDEEIAANHAYSAFFQAMRKSGMATAPWTYGKILPGGEYAGKLSMSLKNEDVQNGTIVVVEMRLATGVKNMSGPKDWSYTTYVTTSRQLLVFGNSSGNVAMIRPAAGAATFYADLDSAMEAVADKGTVMLANDCETALSLTKVGTYTFDPMCFAMTDVAPVVGDGLFIKSTSTADSAAVALKAGALATTYVVARKVAQVGEAFYDNLNDAITAANGAVVTLLAATDETVSLAESASFTLALADGVTFADSQVVGLDGCTVKKETVAGGTLYKAVKDVIETEGGTSYTSVTEAIAGETGDEISITVKANVTEEVEVPQGKTVKITVAEGVEPTLTVNPGEGAFLVETKEGATTMYEAKRITETPVESTSGIIAKEVSGGNTNDAPNAADLVAQLVENAAIERVDNTGVAALDKIEVAPTTIIAVKTGDQGVIEAATFDVTPKAKEGHSLGETMLKFRLPVDAKTDKVSAKVSHEGAFFGVLPILNETVGETVCKFVEVESNAFSPYGYELLGGAEDPVAIIGGTGYATLAEAFDAVQDGDTIILVTDCTFEGVDSIPANKTFTIQGNGKSDGCVKLAVPGTTTMSGCNVTFKDLIIDKPTTTTFKGFQHVANEFYENCRINGELWIYGSQVVFKGCDFVQTENAYCPYIYGSEDVLFDGCTFNVAGKAIKIAKDESTDTKVVINGCSFNTSVAKKPAVMIDVHANKTTLVMDTESNTLNETYFEKNTDGSFNVEGGKPYYYSEEHAYNTANKKPDGFGEDKYMEETGAVRRGYVAVGTDIAFDADGKIVSGTFKYLVPEFVNEAYRAELSGTTDPVTGEQYYTISAKPTVAKIGDVKYATLAEAVAAAQAGDTVTLLEDVVLESAIQIGKRVTLDLSTFTVTAAENCNAFELLAGCQLTVNADATNPGRIVCGEGKRCLFTDNAVFAGAKSVVINGGVFDGVCEFNPWGSGHSGEKTAALDLVINGGLFNDEVIGYRLYHATVNGGTFEKRCEFGTTSTCYSAFKGGKFKVEPGSNNPGAIGIGDDSSKGIRIFDAVCYEPDGYFHVIKSADIPDDAAAKVGTTCYYMSIEDALAKALTTPDDNRDTITLLKAADVTGLTQRKALVIAPNGQTVTGATTPAEENCFVTYDADGNIVVLDDSAAVAKIGDVKYATLAEALDAAVDGDTVALLKDIEGVTGTFEITKAITLDGNGHKIVAAVNENPRDMITAYLGARVMFQVRAADGATFKNLTVDGGTTHYYTFLAETKGGVFTVENTQWLHGGEASVGGTAGVGYGAAIHVNGGNLLVDGTFHACTGGKTVGVFPFTGILYDDGGIHFNDGVTATIGDDLLLVGMTGAPDVSTEEGKAYVESLLAAMNVPAGFAPYTLKLSDDSSLAFTGASPLSWNDIIDYGKQIMDVAAEAMGFEDLDKETTPVEVGLLADTELTEAFAFEDSNLTVNGNGNALSGTITYTDEAGRIENVELGTEEKPLVLDMTEVTKPVQLGDAIVVNDLVIKMTPEQATAGTPVVTWPTDEGVEAPANEEGVKVQLFDPETKEPVVTEDPVELIWDNDMGLAYIGPVEARLTGPDREQPLYTSLAEAIAQAENGETVTLMMNIENFTGTVEIEKSLTFDGAGHKIAAKPVTTHRDIFNAYVQSSSMLKLKTGAVTLKNITLDGDASHAYTYLVSADNSNVSFTTENVNLLNGGELMGDETGAVKAAGAGYGAAVHLNNGATMVVKDGFYACTGGTTDGVFPFTGILVDSNGANVKFDLTEDSNANPTVGIGGDLLLVGMPVAIDAETAQGILDEMKVPTRFVPYTLTLGDGSAYAFTGASPLGWNDIIEYGKEIMDASAAMGYEGLYKETTPVEVGLLTDTVLVDTFKFEDSNFTVNGNGNALSGTIEYTDEAGQIENVELGTEEKPLVLDMTKVENPVHLGDGIKVTDLVIKMTPEQAKAGTPVVTWTSDASAPEGEEEVKVALVDEEGEPTGEEKNLIWDEELHIAYIGPVEARLTGPTHPEPIYTSLAEAIAQAAQSGDTVTLMMDLVDYVGTQAIDKSLTLDGAGHTISAKPVETHRDVFHAWTSGTSMLKLQSGEITLKNITLDGDASHAYTYLVSADNGNVSLTTENVTLLHGGELMGDATTGEVIGDGAGYGAAVHLNNGATMIVKDGFYACTSDTNNTTEAGVFPFTGILVDSNGANVSFNLTADSNANPTVGIGSDLLLVGMPEAIDAETAQGILDAMKVPTRFIPYTLTLGDGSAYAFTGASPLGWNAIIDYGKEIMEVSTAIGFEGLDTEETPVEVGLLTDTVLPDEFVFEDSNFTVNGNGNALSGTIEYTDNAGLIENIELGTEEQPLVLDMTEVTKPVQLGDGIEVTDLVIKMTPEQATAGTPVVTWTSDAEAPEGEDKVAVKLVDNEGEPTGEEKNLIWDEELHIAYIGPAEVRLTGPTHEQPLYTTLTEALEAAEDGDAIKLLEDVALTDGVTFDKNVTLDLAGKEIGGESAAMTVGEGKTLTINDGSEEGSGVVASVLVNDGGKLVITSGTFEKSISASEKVTDPTAAFALSGGTYSENVIHLDGGETVPLNDVCVEGYEAVYNGNNTWSVVPDRDTVAFEPKADDAGRIEIVFDEGAGSKVPVFVSDAWVRENFAGYYGSEATKPAAAEINAKLDEKQENGMKVWQNYLLGFDGSETAKPLSPDGGDSENKENVIVKSFRPVNLPKLDMGVTVSFVLLKGTPSRNTAGEITGWTWNEVQTLDRPEFPVALEGLAAETYWRIKTVFRANKVVVHEETAN